MTLHFIRAARLREKLVAGIVTPQEQAAYMAGSFAVWLLPGYLFVIPTPSGITAAWFYGLWFYELAMLLLISIAGTFYCLSKCQTKPSINFLIDFSCLYFPISLTTIVVAWSVFHLFATGLPFVLTRLTFESEPSAWLLMITSARFFDLLRFLTLVGTNFVVFWRLAKHMHVASMARAAPNLAIQPTANGGS